MLLGREREAGVPRRNTGDMNSNSRSVPDLRELEMVPLPSFHFPDSTRDTIMTTTV